MQTQTLSWPNWLPRVLWVRRECPLCTSIQFRTEEPASLDRALRVLAMRRVRCVNCWRRYYWFARVGSRQRNMTPRCTTQRAWRRCRSDVGRACSLSLDSLLRPDPIIVQRRQFNGEATPQPAIRSPNPSVKDGQKQKMITVTKVPEKKAPMKRSWKTTSIAKAQPALSGTVPTGPVAAPARS
jgi:hypothetical protein